MSRQKAREIIEAKINYLKELGKGLMWTAVFLILLKLVILALIWNGIWDIAILLMIVGFVIFALSVIKSRITFTD